MDDKNASTDARAPEIEDLIKICDRLNQIGAKYILIGGFAVAFQGYPRGTKDIDFLVDASESNIKKIKEALSFLPDNAISELKDGDVETYNVVRVADEVVIDLLKKACQIDYEMALPFVDYFEIENVEIPVAGKEILIKMKDTVRPSDKNDVEFLKASLAEEKKQSKS